MKLFSQMSRPLVALGLKVRLRNRGLLRRNIEVFVEADSFNISEDGKTAEYNGKEGKHGYYNFKKVKIHTVGKERSDADEGVSGASASKMRAHAASGNEKEFHKMAPSAMSTKHKHELYKDVRHGMGLHEAMSFKQFLERI